VKIPRGHKTFLQKCHLRWREGRLEQKFKRWGGGDTLSSRPLPPSISLEGYVSVAYPT